MSDSSHEPPLEGEILPPDSVIIDIAEVFESESPQYRQSPLFITHPHPLIILLAIIAVITLVVILVIGITIVWIPVALGLAVVALIAGFLRRR